MTQKGPEDGRKVALVTGCDSEEGIGQALCRDLAGRGFIVYATGLSLEAMAQLRAYATEQIRTLVMDVTNEGQIQDVINKVWYRNPLRP
jgi:NAD(P)-dependent dehydrogenase (short-subunit alcohol dehydrogenase family)